MIEVACVDCTAFAHFFVPRLVLGNVGGAEDLYFFSLQIGVTAFASGCVYAHCVMIASIPRGDQVLVSRTMPRSLRKILG